MVDMEDDVNANSSKLGSRSVPVLPKELSFDHKEKEVKVRSEMYQTDPEIETNFAEEVQSGNKKIWGVSLTDFFTVEQLKEHILSFRKWVGKVSTLYYCFGYAVRCLLSAFSCMVLYISVIFL